MILENLNEKQQEAVKTTEGPLLVLAGAGSGKTRVLTTRIAYLIEEIGIDPYHLLAITFTNKAAKEMKDRVVQLLGPVAFQIQISTFHSLGLLILKENCEKLGFQSNFTIIDSDDTLSTIKKILKELNLDPKQYNPKAIKNKISGAKNELMDPSQYKNYATTEFEDVVLRVYQKYQEKLKQNNSFDFDDLLMMPIVLFQKNPDCLKHYQERFQYVLVDEYQDTNQAQYIFIKMLSAKYKNICVVGDDYQSIYGFRGSNYRNILNFEKDYQNSKVILLEQNYRSTKNILKAANDVIKNNKWKKEKNLWTENEEGLKIRYHRSFDEKEESYYVVNTVKKLLEEGASKSSIAVLYRTNAQSRSLEDEFLRNNIPYKVVGSFYFYNRKEIKDLISYLKLIYNPRDDMSLLRIINVPKRGIGLKTLENLTNKANQQGTSLYETISSGKELEFKKMMESLREKRETCSLTELITSILEDTGMKFELESENTIESNARLENLEEFKSITKNFEEQNGIVSLEDFLSEISLVSDREEYKENSDVVTLMTVHSSKGLEFDYVFIVGLEEGIFPHMNSFSSSEDLEEERRLCYVSITRAKKELWLLNARRRLLYGMDSNNPPSRFINEINSDCLECDVEEIKEPTAVTKNVDESIEYKVGDHVFHDTFGEGVIVCVDKTILTIAFPNPYGIKKMIKGHKSIRKED